MESNQIDRKMSETQTFAFRELNEKKYQEHLDLRDKFNPGRGGQ